MLEKTTQKHKKVCFFEANSYFFTHMLHIYQQITPSVIQKQLLNHYFTINDIKNLLKAKFQPFLVQKAYNIISLLYSLMHVSKSNGL